MTTHTTDVNPIHHQVLASFILGVLSLIFPVVGIFLGMIGIILYFTARKHIDQTDQMNKNLLIAGLCFSLIGFVIQLFIIVGILFFIFFLIIA